MLTESSLKLLRDVEKEWKNRCFGFKSETFYEESCTQLLTELSRFLDRPKPILLFFNSPVACLYAAGIINEARSKKISISEVIRNSAKLLWNSDIVEGSEIFNGNFLTSETKDKIKSEVLQQFDNKLFLSYAELRLRRSNVKGNSFLGLKFFPETPFEHHLESLRKVITIHDFEAHLEEIINTSGRDIMLKGLATSGGLSSMIDITFFNIFVLCDFYTRLGLINDPLIDKTIALFRKGIFDIYWEQDFCFISKLPTEVQRDAAGELHNQEGPAVKFIGDFSIYAIRGRQIRERIWKDVENDDITLNYFLEEKNLEVKTAIFSLLGEEKMIRIFGAKEIDKRILYHKNGEEETVSLYKTESTFEFIQNQPFAWVKITCPSTGRNYLLGVEPNHTNAYEALVSLSPFQGEDYSFDFRT